MCAHGHYEQALYVSQEHDLVVVFNGDVPDGEFYPADSLIRDRIIPAIDGEGGSPSGLLPLVLSGSALIVVIAVVSIAVMKKRKSGLANAS
ncbi:MAG: hypothetical protein ACXAAR_01515 [Candidatus Thorarchaeota archaeon]